MNYRRIAKGIEGRGGRIARLGYRATEELSKTACDCRVGEDNAWWSPCEKHRYWLERLLCRWAIHRCRQRLAQKANDAKSP